MSAWPSKVGQTVGESDVWLDLELWPYFAGGFVYTSGVLKYAPVEKRRVRGVLENVCLSASGAGCVFEY